MAKKLKSLNPIIGTGYKTLSMIKDGEDGNIENFPDTLPEIPRLSYKRLGVAGLEIGWEFEDKIYYTYELYGSTTKGFEASEENLMFQGLASSYFYEAKPGERWYFKARAKNTHGRYTEFSSELVAHTIKLDNLGEYVEGGAIHGALIENATINNAHIKDLHADKITAGVLDADRIGANSITANKIEANAITSEKIQANAITTDKLAANIIASNHIQSDTIESGHIKAGTIESDHIKSNSINSNHIQANTIQSEHIQTGAITAGSGIIADGAIGNAQISKIDAGKIEAGTIDTSRVTIQGANGHLRLKGNRMQVFQGVGNQAKERVSVGDVNGDGTVYGLRVRGADGQTILLDENGVKSEGITDGSITNDKINEDANIDGAKLNINSVINKINTDGTEVIQGTKVEVDGTNLGVKLSEITNKQTEDSEKITQAYSQIEANEKAIKLKVDEQTYTTDKEDMTSKLEKNTSEISAMKGQIALKVEQTDIENAKNEINNSIDTKIASAKADIQVTTDGISQTVGKLETTTTTVSDKLDNLSVGARNYLPNTDFSDSENLPKWTASSPSSNSFNVYENFGANLDKDSFIKGDYALRNRYDIATAISNNKTYTVFKTSDIVLEKNTEYTISFYMYKSSNCGKCHMSIYPVLESGSLGTKCGGTSAITEYTGAFEKHTVTFTTNAESNKFSVRFYNYHKDTLTKGYSDVHIYHPMVAKGNKPMDWSVSPEDVQTQIDEHTTQITNTNSKVASIETDLSGITSRVENVETISIENFNNLLVNSNIKESTTGWKLSNLVFGTSLRNSITSHSAPDRHAILIGDLNDLTKQTRYMDSEKFVVHGEEKISISFHAMTTAYTESLQVYLLFTDNTEPIETNNSYMQGYDSISVSGSWEKYTMTSTAPAGATRCFVRIRYVSKEKPTATENNRVSLCSIMVNRGDKYPTWTANTEDNFRYHEARLTTAESKITDTAITNTVKKNFYTKSEAEEAITSKGYQTSSEVQQTVDGLEMKFQQSGGYNLLYNGDFRRGTDKWAVTNGFTVSTGSGNYTSPDRRGVCMVGQSGKSGYIHQNISSEHFSPVNFNVSGYVYVSSSGTDDSSGVDFHYYVRLSYDDGTKTYHRCTWDKTVYNEWHFVELNFSRDTSKTLTEIRVSLAIQNTTRRIYLSQAMLSQGTSYKGWSPNPNEVYDGVTTIDKDGIKVSQSNYNGYTQMKADGFYVNNGSENVISVTSSGATFKGKVTIQSGSSVPTSTLSGTISSNQLNSSITSDINNAKNNASSALSTANTAKNTADTAKSTADSAKTTATSAQSTANTANSNATNALNTANSVNSTVNSNKDNWSNAYNRVNEWAYGAVTGSTTIDGGYLQANTVVANKLAVGDFNNYATVNEYIKESMLPTTFKYGGTAIRQGSNQCISSSSTTKQYLMMCDFTRTTFKLNDEILVEGYVYSHHTETKNIYANIWGYDADKSNVCGASFAISVPSKTWTKVKGTIKLTDSRWGTNLIVYHLVGLNMGSDTTISKDIDIWARGFTFCRKSTGELIVDGAITTDHIHTNGLNANVIKAGTISADRLDANTIVSKVNGGTTEINGNRIQTGTLSASKITTGTLDASKVNVTNLNASKITSGTLDTNKISIQGGTTRKIVVANDNYCVYDGAISDVNRKVFMGFRTNTATNVPSVMLGYNGINPAVDGAVTSGGTYTTYSHYPNNDNPESVNLSYGALAFKYGAGYNQFSTFNMYQNGDIDLKAGASIYFRPNLRAKDNHVFGIADTEVGSRVPFKCTSTIYSNGDITTDRGLYGTYLSIQGNAGVSNQLNAVKIVTNGVDVYGYTNLDGNVHVSGNLGVVGDLTVRNKAIYGMGNIALARGTIYLPQGGGNNTTDYLRIGGGFVAGVSSGNFHFLTSNGNASNLYASNVRSAYSLEPNSRLSDISALEQIDAINVVSTSEGLRLSSPNNKSSVDESKVVTKVYNEKTNQEEINVDYNCAISTLWKAIQELRQENDELKEIIKDIHSKL